MIPRLSPQILFTLLSFILSDLGIFFNRFPNWKSWKNTGAGLWKLHSQATAVLKTKRQLSPSHHPHHAGSSWTDTGTPLPRQAQMHSKEMS